MNPFPIDAFAYGNRLRRVAASEKMLFGAGLVALAIGFKSLALSAVIIATVTAVMSRNFSNTGQSQPRTNS